jgi:dipeptidyl-peptidase-4
MSLKHLVKGGMSAVILLIAGCVTTGEPPLPAADQTLAVSAEDYKRAERFLYWNADGYVANGNIKHHWIGSSDRFWYLRRTDSGKEFVVVDAASGERQPAFDHAKLAAGLSLAAAEDIDAENLPFKTFSFSDEGDSIQLGAANKRWSCDLAAYQCEEAEPPAVRPGEFPSPDGQWAAFVKDHNIWLRSLADSTEKALTTTGEEHFSYGKLADSSTMSVTLRRMGMPLPPIALWSPDSKKPCPKTSATITYLDYAPSCDERCGCPRFPLSLY